MELAACQDLLDQLLERATHSSSITGLVARGSTGDASRPPDEYSDHDVWVVTSAGAAAGLRDDPSSLPDADRIVGHFVTTAHGGALEPTPGRVA